MGGPVWAGRPYERRLVWVGLEAQGGFDLHLLGRPADLVARVTAEKGRISGQTSVTHPDGERRNWTDIPRLIRV